MSASNGRLLHAGSTVLLWAVSIVVTVLDVLSFVVSYATQVQLVVKAHVPETVAWAVPLIVDGTVIVATFGTLILHGRRASAVRLYPWLVLLVFGGLSIYANGIHGIGRPLTDLEAFIIGAVAPAAVLVSTHLLVLMLTSPEKIKTDDDILREEQRARAAQTRATTVATAATATRPAVRVSPAAAGAANPGRDAAKARAMAQFRETGEWPSGSTVGAWLGQSSKTGNRVVNEAKSELGRDTQDAGGSTVDAIARPRQSVLS